MHFEQECAAATRKASEVSQVLYGSQNKEGLPRMISIHANQGSFFASDDLKDVSALVVMQHREHSQENTSACNINAIPRVQVEDMPPPLILIEPAG